MSQLRELSISIQSLTLAIGEIENPRFLMNIIRETFSRLKDHNPSLHMSPEAADPLIRIFREHFPRLHRHIPHETIKFLIYYLSCLMRGFRIHIPGFPWQGLVANGLIPAITTILDGSSSNDEVNNLAARTLVPAICGVLAHHLRMGNPLRAHFHQAAATLLHKLASNSTIAQELILDTKTFGFTVLSQLLFVSIKYRPIYAYLQLAVQLLPSNKTTRLNTAQEIFGTSTAQTLLGPMLCETLVESLIGFARSTPILEIVDTLLGLVGLCPNMPQRFCLREWTTSSPTRLYIDDMLNMIAYQSSGESRNWVVSFEEVEEILILPDGAVLITVDHEYYQRPHASLTFKLMRVDLDRFRETLGTRGLDLIKGVAGMPSGYWSYQRSESISGRHEGSVMALVDG